MFSLERTVPSGSELKITAPDSWVLSPTNAKDHIYFSKTYSSVNIDGANLVISVLEEISAESEVEVYVENALTFSEVASATGKFIVVATYAGITIIDDDG